MKRILFVEDDAILARVYCRALESAGFEVQHAPDGESGLALLQVLRPDIILLDLMLPRVSGMDLLRIIRGSQDIKETPVVVFTSAYREELRAEVEELGANRVLS
jgi:DNA-binding response OmpR family regulator